MGESDKNVSEKRMLNGKAPILDDQDAPPPYEARPGELNEDHNDSAHEPPPGYHDEKHPLPEFPDDKKPKDPLSEKGPLPEKATKKDPPLPATAKYLLDIPDRDDIRVLTGYYYPPSPTVFEFELACLVCFRYASECGCKGKGFTWTDPKDFLARKPSDKFGWSAQLEKRMGKDDVRLASHIAHTLWGPIVRGWIPIYNHNCLVVLRSRAMDRMKHPKDVLKKMSEPLEREPDGYKAAYINEGAGHVPGPAYRWDKGNVEMTRMPDGKTSVDGNALPCRYTINTSDEEDFLFYCSILPSPFFHKKAPPPRDPSKLNWDFVLASLLNEVLTCEDFLRDRYQMVPRETVCTRGTLRRLVIRPENFGIGPGFMVAEQHLPKLSLNNSVAWAHSFEHNPAINDARQARKGAFMSSSRACQPQLGDLAKSTPGSGWNSVLQDVKSDSNSFLPIKRGSGLFAQRTKLGLWKHPLRGVLCTGACMDAKGGIKAEFAGFAPPNPDAQLTTVYHIQDDGDLSKPNPLAWLVVAQYAGGHPKPLYFVGGRECTGCTIVQAPKGSIVATKLGKLAPWVGISQLHDAP